MCHGMGCQPHRGAHLWCIKFACALLAKLFASRTVLTEGTFFHNLPKGTVWASTCSVRFAVFLFLSVCK